MRMRKKKRNVRRSGSASCLHARAGVSLKQRLSFEKHRRDRRREKKKKKEKRVLRATSSGRLGASGYTHV